MRRHLANSDPTKFARGTGAGSSPLATRRANARVGKRRFVMEANLELAVFFALKN